VTGEVRTVIIVGAEPRKVVTVARSLRRAGVRCLVATPRGESLRVSSRAIAGTLHLHGDVAEQAEVLSRLARSEGARWVVPTSDRTLRIVSAAHRELSRTCAVGAPPPAIVQRVLDRSVLFETARNAGVPAPLPVAIARAGDLESILHRLRFPLVARPRDTSAKSAYDFETRIFASADELRATFATQTRFGEGLLFHPYHGGQSVGVELLLSKGALITSFQHRRLSESPPSGGAAVLAVSEAIDVRLLEHSVRLLRALEWDGVASVKFRCDGATGESSLMDVSGHFWGSLPLDIAAGMDFPLFAWQLSQGITPSPPASYPYGIRIRWTAGSLARAGSVFADSSMDRVSLGAALRQLGTDFAPGIRSAMWSWSDPIPALEEVAHVLTQWAKDATKFVLRAIVPASLLSIAKDSRNLVAERRPTYVRRRLLRMLGAERAVSLPRPAESVLFVCHGNIMRSAAAAGFLRDELRAAGVANVRIGSAGTHAHDGRPADARAVEAAREFGLSLREHAATRITRKLVADYDVIFAMDDLNYVNILTTFPESRRKLRLFGGMSASGSYRAHEIPDPYMTSASEVTATIGTIKGYVAMLARALVAARADRATGRTPATGREHGVGA
jgi:protein-tyrosine-phosphatase/predicted ATP-grasp superfamily ATP-dependent carboligase